MNGEIPMSDSTRLQRAIADFAARHPEWGRPEGAKGQCLRASEAFLDFCLERGLISPVPETWEWEVIEVGVVNDRGHHVVRIRETFVDFTARQVDPSAPFPKVWQDQEEWAHVQEIVRRKS